MQSPLLSIRIFLTIVITLVIGLFPHHHHHGEICWALETNEIHHHKGKNHTQECPSHPCDDSTCFLQSMQTFLQTERSNNDYQPSFVALVPEFFQITPFLGFNSNPKITQSGCLFLSILSKAESRRGPPMC